MLTGVGRIARVVMAALHSYHAFMTFGIADKLRFHAVGDWPPDAVRVLRVSSGRRIVSEVEQLIDAAWASAMARPEVRLFDGPMCRMESWNATPDHLEIALSDTSYKPFLGTNLAHPELADRYGRDVMANPVGVSPALETADGFLLLGRRNSTVAYYPERVHPFAGALEPKDDGNLFAAVRRELFEELSLSEAQIADIRCTGIAEDLSLRQPELIFRVKSTAPRAQIESQMQTEEHRECLAIEAEPNAVAAALDDPGLTPVAIASLLLWGRVTFGQAWYAA
jgi:8-oxo-dGTP pyrophosphatase MutT (NUDIX family)